MVERVQAEALDDVVGGCPGDTINKLLSFHHFGLPPTPPPPPTPAPPPARWTITGTGCDESSHLGSGYGEFGHCVSSKNFPQNYGNNEACSVSLGSGGTLAWFEGTEPVVEANYD